MEEFRQIEEFPNYEVSNLGNFRKHSRNDGLTLSPTLYGDLTVGMTKCGRQYRYSAKGIVARVWVDGWTPIFNTPIQKDGDRTNLRASNIVWRPRWFAIAYTKQFQKEEDWWFVGPVVDDTTGESYKTMIEAAIDTGTLVYDLRLGIMNKEPVFPTGSIFKFVY